MKIAVGCDPNAAEAKTGLIAFIEKNGLGEVTDFGSDDRKTFTHFTCSCGFD